MRKKLTLKLLSDFEEIQDEALRIAEIKSDKIIESFDFERKKRSYIQYKTPQEDITSKAQTSFTRAKEFVYEMERLIEK